MKKIRRDKLQYVNELKKSVGKEEDVDNIIKVFSKYLNMTNNDYRYNQTYLEQFIDDFLVFKRKVLYKADIFECIFASIPDVESQIELQMDKSFYAIKYGLFPSKKSKQSSEIGLMTTINQSMIISTKIEIWCKLTKDTEILLFHKQYKRDNQSVQFIASELQEFINNNLQITTDMHKGEAGCHEHEGED